MLLLIASCTQEKTQDPYERAAACEEIISKARACRMYVAIASDDLMEIRKTAGRKSKEYAQLWEDIQEVGDCNRLKVRECELFLEDFHAGRVQ